MNTVHEQKHARLAPGSRPANGRPRVHLALRSGQRGPEVRIRVSWSWRASGRAAARLLIVVMIVLAAAAGAMSAHDELARGVLCSLAGFWAGSRRRP